MFVLDIDGWLVDRLVVGALDELVGASEEELTVEEDSLGVDVTSLELDSTELILSDTLLSEAATLDLNFELKSALETQSPPCVESKEELVESSATVAVVPLTKSSLTPATF